MKLLKNNKLSVGIIVSYILIILNIITGLVLSGPIIKSVGQSNYGIYSAANALVHIFLLDFGLSTAATKYISEYRLSNDKERINKLLKVIFISYSLLAIIFALVFAIIFIFLPNIYSEYTPDELHTFKIVFGIIAIYSVISFPFTVLNGILTGFEKVTFAKIADIIGKIAFVISTVICIVLNLGIYALTICFLINGLVGILFKLGYIIKYLPISIKVSVSFPDFKKIAKKVLLFSFWAAINTLSRTLLVSAMSLVMGQFAGPAEYSNFAIAAQIESYISMFATIFGTIFFPKISEILLNEKKTENEKAQAFFNFYTKVSKVQVTILLLITFGFITFGQQFISLWIPSVSSETVYICGLILCVPCFLVYPLQVGEIAMATIGKIKHCAIFNLISTTVGIVTAIPLSKYYGCVGASIGIAIAYVLRVIFFNVVYKKSLKVSILSFYKKTYLQFIPVAFFALLISALYYFYPEYSSNSWLSLIKNIVIFTVYYLVFCFCFIKEPLKIREETF